MRRLPHLALAVALLAALLSPAAFASGGSKPKHHPGRSGCASASAVCVYWDGGPSNASGGQAGGNAGKLDPRIARLIDRYGGKDKNLLRTLASVDVFGHPEPGLGTGPVSGSSALGAIFDLGAGPLALFAALLGGATALGLNGLLRRRRSGRP